MKKKILILSLILASLVAIFSVVALATDTPEEPALKIEAANLSFEDSVYVLYAVSHEGIAAEDIQMLFWTAPQDEYTVGTEAYAKDYFAVDVAVNEKSCTAFKNNELRAKNMADNIYARAYANVDGKEYYSEVSKYSILQYAYNKLGKTGTATESETLKKMLEAMLIYGATAQQHFNYNTARPADGEFYQVKVEGGVLEDGFPKGLYLKGESITLTAPEEINNSVFSGWQNTAGEIIAKTAVSTLVTTSKNETYSAIYGDLFSKGLTYISNGDGTCYVANIGSCKDVDIKIPPCSPEGEIVTEIGTQAFKNCKSIQSITLPDTILCIRSEAFQACTQLKDLTVGKGVQWVQTDAFDGCYALEGVYISDLAAWCQISFNIFNTNPLTYANTLYLNGEVVTDLVIPDGVTSIGLCAFENCLSIERVIIPDSVRFIEGYAFRNCKNVTEIELGSQVEHIGIAAFQNLKKLGTIKLPSTVNYIYTDAFDGCNNLEFNEYDNGLYLGNDLNPYLALIKAKNTSITSCEIHADTRMISGAFQNCVNLASIFIHEGIQSISGYSFYNCDSLTSVTIPNSINYLEYRTFEHCSNLISITLGENVSGFGNDVFSYCNKLVEINNLSSRYIPTGQFYDSSECYILNVYSPNSGTSRLTTTENGFIFFEDGENYYLMGGDMNERHMILPESFNGNTYEIYDNAFYNYDNLESIQISEGATCIGDQAFYSCDNLTNVDISSQVDSIGNFAFYDCVKLNLVHIGEQSNLTSIGNYAFYNCVKLNLVHIDEKSNLTSIGDYAFCNCTQLCSFLIPAKVNYIGNAAFSSCLRLFEIINKSTLDITIGTDVHGGVAYYAQALHEGTSNIVKNNDAVFYVSENEIYLILYVSEERNIVLPDIAQGTPYKISRYAFFDCDDMVSLTIPDFVTTIGDHAFYSCDSLTSVTIGNSVTSIGEDAFSYCYKLVEVINHSSLNITAGWWDYGYVARYAKEVHTAESKIVDVNDYLFYTDNNGVNYLLGYIGNDTELVLPESYNGQNYEIYRYAFYENDNLTSVTIPDSVTEIGERAFYGCTSLTSVTIGNSVTEIGEWAFAYCRSLTSVTIGDSVTSIGDYAFFYCDSLTSVTIGNSVTTIGDYAFSDCSGLTSVTIPNSVTSIGDYAFFDCSKLTSVTVDEGNTAYQSIDGNLYSIDGKTLIQYAIGKTDKHFDIPNSVTEIGNYAFYDCDNLVSVTIPDSVTTIGNYAFYWCFSLTSVTIGNSVTEIGNSAFFNYTNLTSVYYKGTTDQWSEISIGSENICLTNDALYYYSETEPTTEGNFWHYVDGVPTAWPEYVVPSYSEGLAYNLSDDGTYYIVSGIDTCTDTDVVIPAEHKGLPVKEIGEYAFYNCYSLTSVTIPDSVTSIGRCAFSDCYKLVEVINHSSLNIATGSSDYGYVARYAKEVHTGESKIVNINDYLFYTCEGINYLVAYIGNDTMLVLPESYNGQNYVINQYAFYDCKSLTSVIIPDSVTEIGECAFENCDKLVEVINHSSLNITVGSSDYGWVAWDAIEVHTGKSKIVNVNDYLFYTYNGLNYLFDYIGNDTVLVLPESYNGQKYVINQYAFYDNDSLTSVTIPDSVTSIGNAAFYDCDNLTSVIIGNSVTEIGDFAFYNCYNLTSVTIPDSVTKITYAAFSDCNNLIVKENGVHYVDNWVVDCDTDVTVANLREDTRGIANNAFSWCESLTSVTIGNSVTSIGEDAFSYCYNLTSVTIGNSATSIGERAFAGCESLINITITEGNTTYKSIDGNLYSIDIKTLIQYAIGKTDTHFDIPDSVTSIGERAFSGCSNLTSVTIGKSVTSIGDYAFSYCYNLTSVTIPDSVNEIGEGAFWDCYKLVEIINHSSLNITVGSYDYGYVAYYAKEVHTGESKIVHINDYLFYTYDGVNYLVGYTGNDTELVLPESYNGQNYVINQYAFEGCHSLTSVYYKGTADQWSKISISSNNDPLTNAIRYYYSATEPTTEGNFWHYVDGEIVVWPEYVAPSYSEGLAYTLSDDGTYYIVSGIGTCTDIVLVIPPVHEGLPVKEIGYRAFAILLPILPPLDPILPGPGSGTSSSASTFTNVIIPNSVTTIGSSAFSGCDNLTSITVVEGNTTYKSIDGNLYSIDGKTLIQYAIGKTDTHFDIPDSVTEIGYRAFWNCSSLTSVTIGNSVTSIGSDAFYGCNSLTSVTIGNSVTSIGEHAFYDCASLTSVTIPDSVISIGSMAFCSCDSLTSVTIGNSVTSIGSRAFEYCTNLTSVVIGDSVTEIGSMAFYDCSNLTSVTIPDFVTTIGSMAFCSCDSLTSVTIGNSVTEIGDSAFWNCSSLTSVTIPDSVTEIGDSAFSYCTSLTSVTIENAVTSIGSSAFSRCNNLTSITVVEGNTTYKSIDGNLYSIDGKTLIQYAIGKTDTHFDIPDSVTEIGEDAFRNCTSLTSVTIGNSVSSIGEHAFYDCASLTSVTIPDSVTEIGEWAFRNCTSLTSVTIGDSVTEIGEYAFYDCSSLTSISIPDSVTSIGDYAFRYCYRLTSVTIPDSVTEIGRHAFSDCSELTIYCEAESQPAGWDSSWNGSNRPVVWGYTGQEYTYTFVTNGGEAIESVTTDRAFTLPAPTREGWCFCGWYDNAELTRDPVSSPYYSQTMHTLYAKWLTEEEYQEFILKGTSFEYAYDITSGESLPAVIDTAGEYVYFKFTATESKTYTFESSGSYDTYGYLYDENQSQIASNDDSGDGSDFLISRSMSAGETVYIKVKMYSSSATGTFTVSVS